jgi:hypothetical protein
MVAVGAKLLSGIRLLIFHLFFIPAGFADLIQWHCTIGQIYLHVLNRLSASPMFKSVHGPCAPKTEIQFPEARFVACVGWKMDCFYPPCHLARVIDTGYRGKLRCWRDYCGSSGLDRLDRLGRLVCFARLDWL